MAAKRIAILTAVGGQGHMTAANAIDYWLSEWGYNPIVLNVGPSANQEIYQFLLKTPFAYKSFFMVSDNSKVSGVFVKAFSRIVEKSLIKMLPKYGDFDAVISTYPLIHPRKSKKNIMVLLDPVVHASYLTDPAMDYYLSYWNSDDVATKSTRLNEGNSYTIGPLAKPWFYKRNAELKTKTKSEFKMELGLNPDEKLCLVMAGGGWIERSEDYIYKLAEKFKNSKIHFAFVCGKNHTFYFEMKEKYEKYSNLTFLDWLNEEKMSQWLAAADLGLAFTIAQMVIESGLCGVPLYVFDYISGQEEGYKDLIIKYEIGEIVEGSTKEQVDKFYDMVDSEYKFRNLDKLQQWQNYLANVPQNARNIFQQIL